MVKTLTKIGNSQGIILDKPILDLLNVDVHGSFEVSTKDGGLFLKPVKRKTFEEAYERVSKKHRASLDKLGR